VPDADSGQHADPDKFHRLDHHGANFTVRGPLNIPRPPNVQPVLIQARVSDAFINLAAKNAEVVFVVQATLERSRDFNQLIDGKAKTFGRDPDSIKVLPGIIPVVGSRPSVARRKNALLKSLIRPEAGMSFMSTSMNHGMAHYPQDALRPDISEQITRSMGRFQVVIKQAEEEGMIVGEVGKSYAESLAFFSPVRDPREVADWLLEWYNARACDGFVIMPP
jgi:alkanesulfonate monooxygenase SsuD/methylene tetrahydromethanopterin reductase-like flavin-dependent oxidoreductase (luciferase family)